MGVGMLGLCLVAVDVCTNLSLSDIDFLFRRVCDGFLHRLGLSILYEILTKQPRTIIFPVKKKRKQKRENLSSKLLSTSPNFIFQLNCKIVRLF